MSEECCKNNKITMLRDIAITLVVLNHSIIIYNNYWGIYTTNVQSLLFKYLCIFISIFHMPLFFSVSGFLFNISLKKHNDINLKKFAINKFNRLIVPYLFWSLCWLLPIKIVLKYAGYVDNTLIYNIFVNILLGKDNGHLWFLPTLFLIFIIYYILNNSIKNEKIKTMLILVLIILGHFLPTYIGTALANIIWFHVGSYIQKKHLENRRPNKKTWIFWELQYY